MSNSIPSKLVFYNSKLKRFLNDIVFEKNYSFSFLENNYPIMKIPKFEERKLLLIACKDGVKNGILLTKLKFNEDDIEAFQEFYEINNFKVYCFCPILKIEKKQFLENVQIIETEYFLVGGFDIDKNEGLIKLYKVIIYDEIKKKEIEFIQDIKIETNKNFKGFKEPISSIIQTLKGEMLAICKDENVFSFSEPDFEKIGNN